MEDQCKLAKYRVAKEILVPSLKHLGNLGNPSSPSVLHLIRDPRGMLNSIIKLEVQLRGPPSMEFLRYQVKCVTTICEDNVKDFEYLINDKPTLSYKLLRYEDLALNPNYYTKLLFETVNFPRSDEVNNWVTLATQHNVSSFDDAFMLATRRADSKKVPFKWISQLQQSLIGEIEEKCSKMMDMVGYKRVARQLEELNAANESNNLDYGQSIGIIDDSLKSFYLS